MKVARNSIGNWLSSRCSTSTLTLRLVYTEESLEYRYRNVVNLIYHGKSLKKSIYFHAIYLFSLFSLPYKKWWNKPKCERFPISCCHHHFYLPLRRAFYSHLSLSLMSIIVSPFSGEWEAEEGEEGEEKRSSIIKRKGKCLNCVSLNTSGACGNAIWLDFLLRLGTVNDRQVVKRSWGRRFHSCRES